MLQRRGNAACRRGLFLESDMNKVLERGIWHQAQTRGELTRCTLRHASASPRNGNSLYAAVEHCPVHAANEDQTAGGNTITLTPQRDLGMA